MDGIYVASMVLFDDEGKINKEESKKLLDRNLAEGAAGFFVAGSSGECFLMDRQERVQLYEQVSEYKEKADLFAHVGALSTEEAIFFFMQKKRNRWDMKKLRQHHRLFWIYHKTAGTLLL